MLWVLLFVSLATVAATEDLQTSPGNYKTSYWPHESIYTINKATGRDVTEPKDSTLVYGSQESDVHETDHHDDGITAEYVYPYQIIGRHGLGFEHRVTKASGLFRPITPEALEHIGKRYTKKELVYEPLYRTYY